MVSFYTSQQRWSSSLLALLAIFSLTTTVLAANDNRQVHKELQHQRRAALAETNAKLDRAVNSRKRSCSSSPPKNSTDTTTPPSNPSNGTHSGSCFPSAGYLPGANDYKGKSLDSWWCDSNTESGFFGFTYGLDSCPSLADMKSDFTQMRTQYKARYVRIYSECSKDSTTLWNNIITAAYESGLGVMATMWFGFDPKTDPYTKRWSDITQVIATNPMAPYVFRTVDVGSEPMLDQVPGDVNTLITWVNKMKAIADSKKIPVGVSDLPYEWKKPANKAIVSHVDYVHSHSLPFFGGSATTGGASWPSLKSDMEWFAANAPGKKVTITETGWPIGQHDFSANSKSVSVKESDAVGYVNVLNSNCKNMKAIVGQGGVGWFWSTWSENTLTGWGLMKNGKPIFDFKPSVECN